MKKVAFSFRLSSLWSAVRLPIGINGGGNFLCRLALLLVFFAQGPAAGDGGVHERRTKVTGGRKEPGYCETAMVSAVYSRGSGVLIRTESHPEGTSNIVLSAAHCLGHYVSWGSVRFATPDGKVHKYPVRHGFVQPDYTPGGSAPQDYDIAVIVLDEVVDLPGVFPATLGKAVTGKGYRYVGYGNPNSGERRSFSVRVNRVSDHIRATWDGEGEPGGVCSGDSGGPLYREGTDEVVGVVVAATSCDEGNRLIATPILPHRQWIADIVEACAAGDCNPPRFTGSETQRIALGEPFRFTLKLTGDVPESILYEAVDVPPGTILDRATGNFTWTADESYIDSFVDFRFRFAAYPYTDLVDISAYVSREPNLPPVVKDPGPQVVTVGETLSLDLDAHDPEGTDLMFMQKNPIPCSMCPECSPCPSIDWFNGIVTWTPAEAGEYVFRIRVRDNFDRQEVHFHGFPNETEVRFRVSAVEPGEMTFIRGDANGDLTVELSDSIFILNYLFRNGAIPTCMDATDTNDDGTLNLSDVLYAIEYEFLAGPPPPAPHPLCGVDLTGDGLRCAFRRICR